MEKELKEDKETAGQTCLMLLKVYVRSRKIV